MCPAAWKLNAPPSARSPIVDQISTRSQAISASVVMGEDLSPARRPSRYESQKRRDWQTFTRYLGAHRPPLQLRRCSGAHVLEFLRYLDRFGKTRVHAPPCPAYGAGRAAAAACQCQCPLRQAWGSLDALVGRLRAAFDERHGARSSGATTTAQQPHHESSGGDGASANPFAARAVRLYLRDVRDAQARARGISYSRKKKKRNKQQGGGGGSADGGATTSKSKDDDRSAAVGCAFQHGNVPAAATPPAPHPPQPQPYLAGVPFECCDYGSFFGGPTANGGGGTAGFYLPLLFNTFG